LIAQAAPPVDPVDQAIDFIKDTLTLPDGRRWRDTLPADPWIEDMLRAILSTGEDGLPRYKVIYIELARGHLKTGGAAGVSLVEALREPGTEVFAVAADLDQARLLLEALNGQLRRNPALARLFRTTKDEFMVLAPGPGGSLQPTGSRIRVMASDAPSALGLAVDARRLRIVADELTSWPKPDLWFSMATTLPKVADNQMVVLSNAGVDPGESWQWGVREAAREHGYLMTAEGSIASWISDEDLARVAASVPPAVYQRFHENVWVEEVGGFVPAEWFDRCRSDIAPLDDKAAVVVGVDAAVSGDCFAIVAVTRDPDRFDDGVAVRDVQVWTPPTGGSIDYAAPWDYLSGLCSSRNIVQIAFDPFQLHDFMTRFEREHQVWCNPFEQGQRRAIADCDLLAMIRDRRLRHGGDPTLRQHILNCGLKVGRDEDSRARLVKRGRGKIDAAVALSMAASECLRLIL
jgi:phage terminase large subunit-like protein